jgi:SEC-C motif-containing protein
MTCPCGSEKNYDECCLPYISGKKMPLNAEALMRSRYSAFAKSELGYIQKTLAPDQRASFNEADTRAWSKNSIWLGLEIISVKKGTQNDRTGVVEFNARYKQDEKVLEHHEVAEFRKENDEWYFVDGDAHVHEDGQSHHHHEPKSPIVRATPKAGRNDPCSCGSGNKYKKCCG